MDLLLRTNVLHLARLGEEKLARVRVLLCKIAVREKERKSNLDEKSIGSLSFVSDTLWKWYVNFDDKLINLP